MQTEPNEVIPARMLNEFAYCPRLFWYEHVEGLFRESADTVDGARRHSRHEKPAVRTAPAAARARRAAETEDPEAEVLHTTALQLGSERLGIVAKLDIAEEGPDGVVPIEFKRGKAPDPESRSGRALDVAAWAEASPATAEAQALDPDARDEPLDAPTSWTRAWEADLVQLGAQVLVLEDNGYRVPYAVLSYLGNRKRVRVPVCAQLRNLAVEALSGARGVMRRGEIPPPLVDDRRCERCSLAPICMPEETSSLLNAGSAQSRAAASLDAEPPEALPRIIPARDDEGVLYVNTQGARVGKSGEALVAKDATGAVVGEAPLIGLRQVNLMGNVQITTQALQELMKAEIPVGFFSLRGYYYGTAAGMPLKNISLRIDQFRVFGDAAGSLPLARAIVAAKIANQRTVLMRNHAEPGLPEEDALELRRLRDAAAKAESVESLLGHEGAAARLYFGRFGACLRGDSEGVGTFDFEGRNRRPPTDPVNALLSFAYALLAKDLALAASSVGFDAQYGFFHKPRAGRPALALDLMEEFRPLVADSVVLHLVNNRIVTGSDFLRAQGSCALTDAGRAKFFEAYERRKDVLVTHPVFGYRLSYSRMFEVQARMLARAVQGEAPLYRGFTTR